MAEHVERHPLRDDIIATAVVNEMVNIAGITFVFRLREEIGAAGSDAVIAYAATTEIFAVHDVLAEIHAHEHDTPLKAVTELRVQTRRLIDRSARWLLANRPQPLAVDAQITRYYARIHSTAMKIRGWLHGGETAALDARTVRMVSLGAPHALASRVAELLHVFCLLDITDITGHDFEDVAELYFTLSEHLRINYYLRRHRTIPEHEMGLSCALGSVRGALRGTTSSRPRRPR